MSAPRSNVGLSVIPDSPGSENPPLREEYEWLVTHAFNGRFLIFSEDYDRDNCLFTAGDNERCIGYCQEGGRGHVSRRHVYIRPSGEVYGWQYITNPRWHGLRSGEISHFRIDDTGDWSDQPWFECVARCDKLERMWREEVEGGDPFGTHDDRDNVGDMTNDD